MTGRSLLFIVLAGLALLTLPAPPPGTALAAMTAPGADARQGGVRRGSVAYVSGDVYYITLGSQAGMADSMRVRVMGKAGDTIATLVVFAVSSKSSACRVESSARAPVVGDAVMATVDTGGASAGDGGPVSAGTAPGDSMAGRSGVDGAAGAGLAGAGISGAGTAPGGVPAGREAPTVPERPEAPPWIAVRGRVTAQYNTFIVDSTRSTLTQPSLSVNLRGDLSGAPIRFEFAGIARSTVTGTTAPFASGGVGRSRLYRLSLEYNDGVNRFGFGRLLPATGLSSGSIDGAVASRKFGGIEVGGAAGFEPDYRYQHTATNRRKILAFAGAGSSAPFAWSAAAAYARTYLESSVERSVASASVTASPSRAVSLNAQTEVDFRFVRNGAVQSKARLSSLLAQLNVRVVDELSVGTGIVAWRPVYPLSTAAEVPDSMRDDHLWLTPMVSVRFSPGGGFSVGDQYATRSDGSGFGDDDANSLSLGYDDVARTGVGLRLTQTLNRSTIAVSTGFGASARRLFGGLVEAALRYQYYRNEYRAETTDDRTNSWGVELSLPLGSSLYLMLAGELASGTFQDYRLLNGSLSWRF